jgi:Sodium/hydrogen exchanger family
MIGILGIDAAWTENEPSGVAHLEGSPGEWRCVAVAPTTAWPTRTRTGSTPIRWTSSESKIINAILFVLIGLQLRAVVDGISGQSASTLGGYALAVTGVVVGTRLVWFFTVPYLIRAIDRRPTQRARRVGARVRLVMAWSGMRAAVSLAAALPLTTAVGGGLPKRDLIVFLTFSLTFFTLVVQGLSLPALIRRLGVSDGGADEEVSARLEATKAALEQLGALAVEEWTRDENRPHLSPKPAQEGLRLAGAVERELDDDVVEVVGGPKNLMATHARALSLAGEAIEGTLPGVEVADRVFDLEDVHRVSALPRARSLGSSENTCLPGSWVNKDVV